MPTDIWQKNQLGKNFAMYTILSEIVACAILTYFHNIFDQKVHFSNILSGADIYSYNKINPMLLTALCLLLTPYCSLLFVYNSVLFNVECLKWGMNVRCEHQCVSDLGLLLLLQLVFMCKNVTS